MMWIETFVILLGAVTQVFSSRISLDDDAQSMCKKYKMICKTGKICAVQHFDYPNNVTFPVCIPLSFVPVRNMICELQPLPGPCGARYIRWFYNKHAQECAYFRYGGCQGNQNNFKSKTECENACMAVPSISLYKGGQSSLSAVKPAILTAPIYEPPELKYEALNSIMLTGNEKNYDRYSATRQRKMQDDEGITRKRRRLEKERAKERRRRERRKERKRLKRLRRQKKLLREGKKPKKDRKKKKNKTEDESLNETTPENSVSPEKQTSTVEEITNIVDNAIAEDDAGDTRRRRDRKRRKRRQKRQKKNKDGKSKKQKRDNKHVEKQYRRHAPTYQNDDTRSYRMLSILDHIANSRTQTGSIVYSED